MEFCRSSFGAITSISEPSFINLIRKQGRSFGTIALTSQAARSGAAKGSRVKNRTPKTRDKIKF